MRVRVRMLFKRGYASRASLPIPFMEWVVRERDDFTLGQDSFGGERRKEVLKGKHLPERKMVSSPKGQFISKLPRRKNHLEALSQKRYSGIFWNLYSKNTYSRIPLKSNIIMQSLDLERISFFNSKYTCSFYLVCKCD